MQLLNTTQTYPMSHWFRITEESKAPQLAYEIYTYFGRRVALFQDTRCGASTPDEVRAARIKAEKDHGAAWIRYVQYVPANQ